MADYIAAGFDPAAFWRLTPREFGTHMRGAQRRMQLQQEGRAWLAWHTAYLPRTEKPIDIQSLAGIERSPEERALEFNAAWDKIDAALARSH